MSIPHPPTLSLHDDLPISQGSTGYPQPEQGKPQNSYPQQTQGSTGYPQQAQGGTGYPQPEQGGPQNGYPQQAQGRDRKSTRLNSSHTVISYAVFCLKKKNT